MKRKPSEAGLDALVDRFRTLWRQSDVLWSWLRKHHAMIRAIVRTSILLKCRTRAAEASTPAAFGLAQGAP